MKDFNWVAIFEAQLNSREIVFDAEGKFEHKHVIDKDTPWILNDKLACGDIDGCTEYHMFFSGENARLGFIHSYCHECWKVVVKPKTVKQLFQLCDLQSKIDYPAKCGIERRPFVPRLYGGYFYNRSLEAGIECLKKVKREVREKIDPSMQVLLKRGCTEFEMKFGASDKWEILPEQIKFEEEFDKVYVKVGTTDIKMPPYLKSYVKTNWLYFAAQNYDQTYKEFTGGVSLINEPDYVEYGKEKMKKPKNGGVTSLERDPEKKTTEKLTSAQ